MEKTGLHLRSIGFAAALVCVLTSCASLPQQPPAAEQEVFAEEPVYYLEQYLDVLKYRVFFFDDSAEEPPVIDAALRAARKYAIQSGALLTEDAGEAGVSLEIDALTDGESRGENHYGTALLRCTVYEPLTGLRLGVLESRAPRTFSKADQFDAKVNALESALSRLVPEATGQARAYLVELYSRGHTEEGALFIKEVTNRILNPKK